MLPFSPSWLRDQRFLETVTVLQNPVPQRGSFVEHKANVARAGSVWRSGGHPTWAQEGLAGRGEGRNAINGLEPKACKAWGGDIQKLSMRRAALSTCY